MRIWYLNHYAKAPSHGGSGRSYFIARELMRLGHEVLVVAAARHHTRPEPAPAEQWNRQVQLEGVSFYHLPARAYHGNGAGRFLNMLDYARRIGSLWEEVRDGGLKKPDVIIASSAHIFVYPPARKLARRFGIPIVFEVRDLWPLSLVDVAGVPAWHPIIWWMARIERDAYRTADAVVSLLPNALEHMEPLGLAPERFHWIPNGVWAPEWEKAPKPLPAEHQEAFDRVRRAGKLVVVYAGAHGPPNALDQLLRLREADAGERPYHVLLIGRGVQKASLAERTRQLGIDFLTFLPPLPRAAVRSALKQADVCIICWQKKRVYRYGVSANKIFEYMMAAKPILQALETGFDPVKEAGAGLSIPPWDPDRLDEALRELAAMDPHRRAEMGRKGRAYALAHHEWSHLGLRYEELCRRLVPEAARGLKDRVPV